MRIFILLFLSIFIFNPTKANIPDTKFKLDTSNNSVKITEKSNYKSKCSIKIPNSNFYMNVEADIKDKFVNSKFSLGIIEGSQKGEYTVNVKRKKNKIKILDSFVNKTGDSKLISKFDRDYQHLSNLLKNMFDPKNITQIQNNKFLKNSISSFYYEKTFKLNKVYKHKDTETSNLNFEKILSYDDKNKEDKKYAELVAFLLKQFTSVSHIEYFGNYIKSGQKYYIFREKHKIKFKDQKLPSKFKLLNSEYKELKKESLKMIEILSKGVQYKFIHSDSGLGVGDYILLHEKKSVKNYKEEEFNFWLEQNAGILFGSCDIFYKNKLISNFSMKEL